MRARGEKKKGNTRFVIIPIFCVHDRSFNLGNESLSLSGNEKRFFNSGNVSRYGSLIVIEWKEQSGDNEEREETKRNENSFFPWSWIKISRANNNTP